MYCLYSVYRDQHYAVFKSFFRANYYSIAPTNQVLLAHFTPDVSSCDITMGTTPSRKLADFLGTILFI